MWETTVQVLAVFGVCWILALVWTLLAFAVAPRTLTMSDKRIDPALINRKLDRILEQLKIIRQDQEKFMAALEDALAAVSAKVAAQTTIIGSVETMIGGIKDQVTALQAKLAAAGATPEQLQMVADLGTTIDANTARLTADVVTNTPAA